VLNPNLDDARTWLSAELRELGLTAEARELLEEVVERDPAYPPAFNNLIQTYAGSGDFDKSDALINRVERIVGDTPDVSLAWGTQALVQGQLARSVRKTKVAYDNNPAATIAKQWFGFVLLDIGDFAAASSAGNMSQQILAHGALGNIKAADELLERLELENGDRFLEWNNAAYYLVNAGRYGELVDLVERHFGDHEGLLQQQSSDGYWGTGYYGPLAYAYLQKGADSVFRSLTEEMGKALADQRAAGIDNRFLWYSQAEYAALTGDVDKVLEQMRRAVASGYVSTYAFSTPIFDSIRQDSRFQEVEQQVLKRVDEERAELGMEPYRPFTAAD